MWCPEEIAFDLCARGLCDTADEYMRAVDSEEKMMLLADEQPTPVELDEVFAHVGAEYCYEANDDEDDSDFDFRVW